VSVVCSVVAGCKPKCASLTRRVLRVTPNQRAALAWLPWANWMAWANSSRSLSAIKLNRAWALSILGLVEQAGNILREGLVGRRQRSSAAGVGLLDVGQGNRVVAREQQRVLDHVRELAHVARPGLALQELHRLKLDCGRGHLY
jgi:hypothetical protein